MKTLHARISGCSCFGLRSARCSSCTADRSCSGLADGCRRVSRVAWGPFPALNAWLVIAAELGGGLALLTGALTRLAGLATAFTMVVAIATVHGANGFFLPAGFEFVLTLLLASLAVVLTGPGAYSIDALTARRSFNRDVPAARTSEPLEAMTQGFEDLEI